MSQTRFQRHVSSPMHCFDPSILRSEACGSIEGSDLVRRGIGGEPHEGEKDFQEAREIWEIGNRSFTPSTSTMRFWGGVDSGRKGGEGGVVSSSKQMQLGCQWFTPAFFGGESVRARRPSSLQIRHLLFYCSYTPQKVI